MRVLKRLIVGTAIALGLMVAVGTAAAALVERMDLDKLTAKADAIVIGTVKGKTSYDEGKGRIFTQVTVAVEETWKGKAQPEVVVVVPGGEVNGLRLEVSDVPKFAVGERAVLFLENGAKGHTVTGWNQGKFSVVRGRVMERGQSLAAFAADIRGSMEAQGIPSTPSSGGTASDQVVADFAGSPPHIDSISPSTGSAGTGTPVTITGTNFGATRGPNDNVGFWRNSQDGYVPAPIVSWSDTQIVCQVPSGASSGTTSGGVAVVKAGAVWSNDVAFTVTFSYGLAKWAGTTPMGEKFFINPNTADCSGEFQAVIDAMQTWNNVDQANFYFEYGGTTTVVPDFSMNGNNEIAWTTVTPPDAPTNWIAVNSVWYNRGVISESDVYFNDPAFVWGTDGSASKMDVQHIATHELGHSLLLLDLYGSADYLKTMYGYSAYGQTDATLEPQDIAGIQWIYNGPGTRGQYHVQVTNNDDDTEVVYFKSDVAGDD